MTAPAVRTLLQLRLPPDTLRKLERLARERFLTKTALARQLLLEQLAIVAPPAARRRKTP